MADCDAVPFIWLVSIYIGMKQRQATLSEWDRSCQFWMTNAGGGRNQLYGLIRDACVGLEGKLEAKQKVWICPRGEKTPFALLFGMPFIASTRATSTWDSRGNMWTKLTSQDGKLSVQYQTVSYSSTRNIVEPQKKPNAESDDLMILPWAGVASMTTTNSVQGRSQWITELET
ncbi:hypothetical protein BDR26DRAFT_942380 [Obelidium mucronatum]|nr:hypothetical protein BDR26DRAFT_942380 [Obelidium mucronatum]